MTGRENIFKQRRHFGNDKKITNKLDEIIEFSGCEHIYRHTGKTLQQRDDGTLAFTVAAFWNHLIIDEVLAVGDANSKKTIGKMQDISRKVLEQTFVKPIWPR
jgi:lipopolysaccharide transport system ATP-binding protein